MEVCERRMSATDKWWLNRLTRTAGRGVAQRILHDIPSEHGLFDECALCREAQRLLALVFRDDELLEAGEATIAELELDLA
jgi:hypothetical protein